MAWSINLLFLMFIQQIFCASGSDPRIVGGKECDYELYPYAVAIFSSFVCGGSFLSLQWILTAAHCINSTLIKKKKVILRTGFNRKKLVQERRVKKGVRHHMFKNELQKDVRYDIGLLLADKPFKQTAHIALAKLPGPGFVSKCETVTAIGIGEERKLKWYDIPTKKVKPNEPLKCIEFPIVNQKKCSRIWNRYVIDESIICAMDEKGDKDSCYGDSGGPIVCKGVVIGVTATGAGCAQPNVPALHTSVEYFLDFIENVTNIGLGAGRTVNGSNRFVPRRVFLIIAVFLHYIIIKGFGY